MKTNTFASRKPVAQQSATVEDLGIRSEREGGTKLAGRWILNNISETGKKMNLRATFRKDGPLDEAGPHRLQALLDLQSEITVGSTIENPVVGYRAVPVDDNDISKGFRTAEPSEHEDKVYHPITVMACDKFVMGVPSSSARTERAFRSAM